MNISFDPRAAEARRNAAEAAERAEFKHARFGRRGQRRPVLTAEFLLLTAAVFLCTALAALAVI